MCLYAADVEIIKLLTKSEIKRFMFPFFLPNYFSLLNACFLPDSLFQFSHKDGEEVMISGINIPWLYFGMLFSTFCWHVEDLFMYSLNYMHSGKPKIWYSIAGKDKEKFDLYVKKNFVMKAVENPGFIYDLSIHIDPMDLIKNGIEVKRTIQYPGELIVTLPKAYHMGFSLGENKSEAVNYTVRLYF